MSNKFFTQIDKEFQQDFKKKVLEAKSIVISSHTSPDEDSISSVLSIYFYLTKILKIDKPKVRILYTGEKVDTWKYFNLFSEVEFVDDIFNHIRTEDLIIFLDGSGWKRFSRKDEIDQLKNYVICIDHHPTPDNKFNLHLDAPQYPACAEIIYRLFFENEELNKEICEILLMGILGDTGNFRYIKPDQSETFLIAERLVKRGQIIVEELQSKYQFININTYKALQELMKNSQIKSIKGWPDFVVTHMSPEFAKDSNLTDSQVSEASAVFTPYLKNLNGVSWGFVITPGVDNKYYRISLRSIPNSVSVRIIMERTGFGGGHDRAAGGKIIAKSPLEALEMMENWMKQNTPIVV